MTKEEEKRLQMSINGAATPTSFGRPIPLSGFEQYIEDAKKPSDNASNASPVETQPEPAASQQPKKVYNSWDDVIRIMSEHTESPEEAARRERREKSRAMVNSIADMGRAIGNMFYTNKYAPNSYSNDTSISETYQKKLDKAKAERDKNRDWWLNYALTKAKMKQSDEARTQAQANWEAEMEASRAAAEQKKKNWEVEQKRKDDEFELKERKLQWQMDLAQGKLDLQKAKLELEDMYKRGVLSYKQKEYEKKMLEYEHKLQPYTETTTIERDARGKEISRTKQRTVQGQTNDERPW